MVVLLYYDRNLYYTLTDRILTGYLARVIVIYQMMIHHCPFCLPLQQQIHCMILLAGLYL